MNAKSITSVLVALCMTGPVIAGQAQGTTQQKKPDAKPAESVQAASKKPAATATEITVPVTGLTADGASKVQGALTEMSAQVWTCAGCHVEEQAAGTCGDCGADLARESLPVLDKVQVAADAGTLRFALRPNRMLSLNELDATLRKNAVAVDGARMPLAGTSTLVLTGLTEKQVAEMEKALVDSKMFASARGTYDAASKQMRIRATAAQAAPTRAAVALMIEQSTLHPRLDDILLGATGAPRG